MIVGGERLPDPAGLVLRTYADDPAVHRFSKVRQMKAATELVAHETTTASHAATVRALRGQGYSVQLIVDADGTTYQHGDLLHPLDHCKTRNGRAVGVELVSPYYPHRAPKGGPWGEIIDAPWAHPAPGKPRRYLLPTQASCEALVALIDWITAQPAARLQVSWWWPGLQGDHWQLTTLPAPKVPRSGLWSHYQVGGHADGSWPLFYAWLRLVVCLSPADAWGVAVMRATSSRGRIYVGDLLAAGRT